MKQKLVLKLDMHDEKCRSKAMKTTVTAGGVLSVALDVKDRNKLVVIGEDMDAFELVASLKKKKFFVEMESLEEVKSEKKDEGKENKKPEENKTVQQWSYICHSNLPQPIVFPVPVTSNYSYNSDPCSMM